MLHNQELLSTCFNLLDVHQQITTEQKISKINGLFLQFHIGLYPGKKPAF